MREIITFPNSQVKRSLGEYKLMNKSVILPAFFKDTIKNIDSFIEAINLVRKYSISIVEFYYEGNEKERIKEVLEKNNLKRIYLGGMAAKIKRLNLSSLNEYLREKSIEELKQCIRDAYFYEARAVLINSGPRPANKIEEITAYQALKKSITELLQYTVKNARDYLLDITLEPGDRDIDFCELIGNTDLAIKLVKDIQNKYANFYLTLDTSHLKQLNEQPLHSIKKAFSYCYHIHLANCVLKDKSSNLYGDKHPEFGFPNSEFNNEGIKKLYNEINEIYKNHRLFMGVEIINRKEDKFQFFQETANKMNWFFK